MTSSYRALILLLAGILVCVCSDTARAQSPRSPQSKSPSKMKRMSLTDVYEPGATYRRCYPTEMELTLSYPVPGVYDTFTKIFVPGVYNTFTKIFPVTRRANGKIDPSLALAGMRAELKRRLAKYGCDVSVATPSQNCQLSPEEFSKARSLYTDEPGIVDGVMTGPYDQGFVYGIRDTARIGADNKGRASSPELALDWTRDYIKFDLSYNLKAGTNLADLDVCGSGYTDFQTGSYSTITLAGQGVSKGTDYIMVNQKFEGYFVTPLLVQDPWYFSSGWDQAAYFNEKKACAPITGDFVPWKIGQRKDVTGLITYRGKSETSTNCNFISVVPPNTILYDIAAPIVVKGMSAVIEGIVKSYGTNSTPSARPLSLEKDPLKFFVKVSGSSK